MRLNKFREDVPVQFVGSKGPPDEETSAMTNYVGEKLHVQKILNEESGMSGYISNDGMAYTGVSTAEKKIPFSYSRYRLRMPLKLGKLNFQLVKHAFHFKRRL